MLISSPYGHSGASVATIMREVLIALVPGIVVTVALFGWGQVWQISIAVAAALALEAFALKLRGLAGPIFLKDGSVVVLAILLALAMPPYVPWWITALAAAFAVLIAKHAFGGVGQNLFNPAMAGYVFVLVCFPRETSVWPAPGVLTASPPGPLDALQAVLHPAGADVVSGATALDYTKAQVRLMAMLSELRGAQAYGSFASRGYEWVNMAYLAGGCWLLMRHRITWRIPLAVLAGLAVTAFVFHASDSERYAGVAFHLFSGATMLGAFFIATDPVTSATTPRGQLVFGLGVGIVIYLVRAWGDYPDGVAIAVLCLNALAPTIERFTQPKLLGGQLR